MSTMSARTSRPAVSQDAGFISQEFDDLAKKCQASVEDEHRLIESAQTAGLVNTHLFQDVCSAIRTSMHSGAEYTMRGLINSVEKASHVDLRSNCDMKQMLESATARREKDDPAWCDPIIQHLRSTYGGNAGKDQAKREIARDLHNLFSLGSDSPNAEITDKGATLRLSAWCDSYSPGEYSYGTNEKWRKILSVFIRAGEAEPELRFLSTFGAADDLLFRSRIGKGPIAFNKAIPLLDGLVVLPRKAEVIFRIPNPKAQALSDFIGAWGPSRPEAD
jgi:hypothetical protein